MTYRVIGIGLAMVLALAACAWAQGDLKQISGGGITISYPPKYEAQAAKVLEIAKKSIQPSVEIHRELVSLLSDPASLATELTDTLGAEEASELSRLRLQTYKNKSIILAGCFSNIRLVETASAVSTGGVDAGALQVRYDRDSDSFKMSMDTETFDPEKAKSCYFPVFVNADGSIRAENKLADMAIDFLGSSRAMLAAPIHETAVYVLTQRLNLYHPFTRWFTEGSSGWVTRRMITKREPKLASLVDELFVPGAVAKKLRDKVNLLAWPQSAFQNRTEGRIDPAMEVAQTQYAVEAVGQLLGGNRSGALAKIVGDIKHDPSADSDVICAAITKITATDSKKTLLSYVPVDIKAGIASGEAKKLISQADKLAQDKKWKESEAKLLRALEMTPNDLNTRLNLAWIERELGDRLDSEIQVFTAARLLKKDSYSFHLFASSLQGNYVLARLSILLGNLEYARKFIEPVLAANPNDDDAKRALEEIKRIEGAAKGTAN